MLPYIRSGLSEGLSATAAYNRWRDATNIATEVTGERWVAGQRTIFSQIYSAVRSARENVGPALEAPKNVPAGGLTIPSRPATVASGFLNWGVSLSRQVGSREIDRNFHPFRSATPLTPAEVEGLIREQINESQTQSHGSFANTIIQAVFWTGTEELTGRQ